MTKRSSLLDSSCQVIRTLLSSVPSLATTLLASLYAAGLWRRERICNALDGGSPWYDTYECADGGYISLGALEPPFYRSFLEHVGLADDPEFAEQLDPRHWPGQKARIAALFRTRTRAEWCESLEGSDACFAPVLDFEEAPRHPHNVARGIFIETGGVRQAAPAPRFSATPAVVSAPPPERGRNTSEILEGAGFSREEVAALVARGVI